MSTNSEIRKQARRALEGNWMTAVVAVVILYAITFIVTILPQFLNADKDNFVMLILPTLLGLALIPLSWGFEVFFLSFARNQEPALSSIFSGYGSRVYKIWLTMFLVGLYQLLWFLLLIVPGIIKTFSYAMTPYILKEYPELAPVDAIHRSRVMMDGHKMKLFLLYLSFLGWGLLALLSLGLGFLLLIPYINTSLATFYEDLKEDTEL